MVPPPMHDSAVSLASMAAWLSFTGISHHSLLPNIPLIHLSSVNSSPCPGITPQYLNSSSQPLRFPGELCPYLGCVCLQQELSDFSFHLGCHSSALSLSALNFSPLTQTIALMWGLDPCFCSPTHHPRAGPVLLTLLFPPLVPSSYQVLHGSIYSFGTPVHSQLVFSTHFCV